MFEHPTCFVSSLTYKKYGLFNLEYKYVADYELMLRLHNKGCSFYLIEEVLADFDENGEGNSWTSIKESLVLRKSEGLINYKQYIYLLLKTIYIEFSNLNYVKTCLFIPFVLAFVYRRKILFHNARLRLAIFYDFLSAFFSFMLKNKESELFF